MSNGSEAAGTAAVGVSSSSPDIWARLIPHLDPARTYPEITSVDGLFQPCALFRGAENWLARFANEEPRDLVRNIRQEVRAISARWLKMQNVCVLVGAGASQYVAKFAGAGLFDRAKSIIAERTSAFTLNALLAHASRPGDIGIRFEEFLSQLSAVIRLSDGTDWPLDGLRVDVPLAGIRGESARRARLKELLSDLEKAVAIACNVFLPESPLVGRGDSLTTHETFLAKLVARDPQCGRARIFTTNYDTLLEQAMDRLGIFYWDGFTGTVCRRFNPAAYDLDLHYPGEVTEGRVRRYDKVLLLYKLHGSINWRRTEGLAPDPYGVFYDSRGLPTADETGTTGGTDALSTVFSRGQGLSILPTSAKYGETLAMPYAHLFRAMGQALREPQTVLFVIGYSGFDRHINRMIMDALTNPGFTCVIVDPKPSEWAKGLCRADLCGRVYCFGGEWGKFEFFAQHVLPDLEVLKTEIAIARTLRDLQHADKGFSGSGTKEETGETGS